MDPNATMEDIADCLVNSRQSAESAYELDEACENLDEWLRTGGFPPDWEAHDSDAVDYFMKWSNANAYR